MVVVPFVVFSFKEAPKDGSQRSICGIRLIKVGFSAFLGRHFSIYKKSSVGFCSCKVLISYIRVAMP